jgi:hypothetical protein
MQPMRLLSAFVAVCLLALPALAVDLGKADGSLTVDKTRIALNYAYAVGHQKDELNNRRDDVRIILTDKPLPEGTKLDDLDYSFPEGILGVVVCVTHEDKVAHVVVQHPHGTYDAGYFENDVYHFKPKKGEQGTISGNLSSPRVPTNTMTFWFVVEFNAVER